MIGFNIFVFLVVFISFSNCDVISILKHPVHILEPPYGVLPQDTISSPVIPVFPQLPEIVVNRALFRNSDNGIVLNKAYNSEPPNQQYLPPVIIPQRDEFPPNNEYLPPSNEQTPSPQFDYFVPLNDYLPPQQDIPDEPLIQYLPPTTSTTTTTTQQPFRPQSDDIIPSSDDNGYNYDAPANNYLPPSSSQSKGRNLKDSIFFRGTKQSTSPIRLDLNDLKCRFDSNGYFKSIVTIQSFIDNIPIIENTSGELIDNNLCDVRLVKSQLIIDISIENFQKCGIKVCDKDLCLRLRFPQIRDLKTLNDPVLVLKCKIQERIITKTHAVKMGINESLARGRSAGTYAQGGSQQAFRSQIGIFRRADDGTYSRPLESGGKVQLGEDLMLRTQIQSGDGWNFTRMSDISLQRQSVKGDIINLATLVTSAGCINPKMRTICSVPPIFEPPLGYRFGFRAAMFQGMRSGDEITMNIKLIGCLDRKDCFVDSSCSDTNSVRLKRDVSETKLLEDSSVSFRIEMPEETNLSNISLFTKSVPFWTIAIASLLCCSLLLIIIYVRIIYRKEY